jgi:hypothetical protein
MVRVQLASFGKTRGPLRHTVLQADAKRLNTTPSRLARLIIETVVADDLLDAVLDGLPRSLRQPTMQKRDRKWEVAFSCSTF